MTGRLLPATLITVTLGAMYAAAMLGVSRVAEGIGKIRNDEQKGRGL